MRFGIPLLADRVAPRCTFADAVLVVTVKGRRVLEESVVPLNGTTWADLSEALTDQAVDTLICGGIAPATRESIRSRDVQVIENVAGTADEVLDALRRGRIRQGFGLGRGDGQPVGPLLHRGRQTASRGNGSPEASPRGNGSGETGWPGSGQAADGAPDMDGDSEVPNPPRNCLECRSRVCLQGAPCPFLDLPVPTSPGGEVSRILDSTWDVALEEERTLCRLAELVYFALEMGYQRLGVAFCEDLREPATILAGVLGRFFEVEAVGCKARGPSPGDHPGGRHGAGDPSMNGKVPCDPEAVARALNMRNTDLNVLVGFCVGADCIFNRSSEAPVTTIFVKDKSLANNPIGAVYSHYHLEDI